jgi:hypothetical protein
MAKYIALNAGGDLVEQNPIVISAGVADAGKIPQTGANGTLDPSVMPAGSGVDVQQIIASEALTAGNLVNLWANTGVINMRKADASNGRQADGFVLANVAALATGLCYFEDDNTAATSLTPGAQQFLSPTTPGATTETRPTTAGHIVQKVGKAFTATSFHFKPEAPVTLA